MDTVRGGRRGRAALRGLGLALALGVAGLLAPAGAVAQGPRPGPGYHGVPNGGRQDRPEFRRHGWRGDDWRRDGERHDDWRYDRVRRDGWRHDGHGWYSPRGWGVRPYDRPVIPYRTYRPGQWLWNGWGWVWVPGY